MTYSRRRLSCRRLRCARWMPSIGQRNLLERANCQHLTTIHHLSVTDCKPTLLVCRQVDCVRHLRLHSVSARPGVVYQPGHGSSVVLLDRRRVSAWPLTRHRHTSPLWRHTRRMRNDTPQTSALHIGRSFVSYRRTVPFSFISPVQSLIFYCALHCWLACCVL